MARIGGRRLWLAIPVGIVCAVVVGTLGYLAIPMVPVTVAWVGQMFHSATNLPRPVPAPESVANLIAADAEIDCRTIYPDDLWAELTWTRHVLLSQTYAAPVSSVEGLTDALAPSVVVTCGWRGQNGATIATTLARVGADAAPVAEAALRAQGFDCTVDAEALTCTRSAGDVVEEHIVRGELWVSSVESAWHPENYASRLAGRIWG